MSAETQLPPPRRNILRTALWITLGVHLVAAAIAVYVIPDWSGTAATSDAVAESGNGSESAANAATTPSAPAAPPEPLDESEAWSPIVENRLNEIVEDAEELDDDEKLANLEAQVNRLNALATEESVDQLVPRIQQWFGTEARASKPATEEVEGPFDSDTAQFHEVRRLETASGRFQYVGVMVDAQGRTLEVEMDAEQGKKSYDTMQLLKDNPLADRVYRRMAMPLLDKMIQARKQLEKAAAEAELQAAQDREAEAVAESAVLPES